MIMYTVKNNDTLSQIAYRYQTTVAIIMGDNPSIKDANAIQVGMNLSIRTSEEFAKDKINVAKTSLASATVIQNKANPPSTGITTSSTGMKWEGMDVKDNQTGLVTVRGTANLYTLNSDGSLKVLRTLSANERYRAYGETKENGGMYVLGGSYVKKSDVVFDALPNEYKVGNNSVGAVTLTNETAKPKSSVKSDLSTADMNIPQFEMPGYRRSRMQVKKKDGKVLTMELRIQAVNTGHSNQYSASRTNEGWALHIGGKNLSSISVNGFLLDSKSNPEADDFLTNYHQHFSPKNSDKYFSAALTTLLHKNREYKGLIEAVNVTEQSDTPLDRKFSMRFLVLSEKMLDSSSSESGTFTIDRKNVNEVDFLSDLKNMLTNPITGKFNTHN